MCSGLISKLADLHAAGALTDAEFERRSAISSTASSRDLRGLGQR
jgi:hypothetical protein